MNKINLSLATAVVLAIGGTASAQERAAGNGKDSYDCALYNECASSSTAGEMERGQTRGWNLSRTLPNQPTPAVNKRVVASGAKLVGRSATQEPSVAPRRQRLATAAAPQMQNLARVHLAQQITFVSGSAELTAAARSNVDRLAAAMLRPDKLTERFRIEGNTDSAGGREMNMDLSKRRASAVFDYLVAKGVEPTRLETVGNGFDKLLPGVPAKSMANRRVEAKLVN